jgi:hypothetical protein
MMTYQFKQCPTCGQPLPPEEELKLPKIKRRIYDAVKRRPGIGAEELRCVVWADDPNGGPEDRKVLHVHVSQLNHLLAPFGIVMRSQGGGYQIRNVS